ncbi:MAG: efflux transporter outer membrane subunit [Acidobacteria bacterium]|nr:efflux transporter outer membrane subunit [Acidobacteriota bacterium]
MSRYLAVLLGIAGLIGCARPIDRPQRSFDVQAPQAWKGGPTSEAEPQGDWWAYFTDQGLDTAVAQALERNKNLEAAAARIDAAEQQARIAGAAELPSASIGLQRTRQRMNFIGLPIPGAPPGSVLKSINTQIGLSMNVSWEPDVWGQIKAGKLAATAELQAVQTELDGARLSLSGQTAKAWFAALEAQRQLQLARASLESYEVSSNRVRARFESGVRPSLDLRLALTEVRNAEARVQQRKQQLDASRRQLEILMGQYPAGEYELAEDLPRCPSGIPAGLPSELVHRRPDLIAAERRLLAADARIAQSKADLRPSFNLTTALGTQTTRLQDVLSGDVLVWNLISGVTQPVFNNGRLKATVSQNEAQAREAAAMYENAILQAYREVETTIAADHILAEQEKALEDAVKQAMAAQDLAEQRYRSGLSDIITVLQSQRTALESESALLTLRRARLDNRVDLHLALGGSFQMTVPSQAAGTDTGTREKL